MENLREREPLKVRILYMCSWCKKELGSAVTVLDPGLGKLVQVSRVGDDGLPVVISHGTCDDCYNQMINELSAKK